MYDAQDYYELSLYRKEFTANVTHQSSLLNAKRKEYVQKKLHADVQRNRTKTHNEWRNLPWVNLYTAQELELVTLQKAATREKNRYKKGAWIKQKKLDDAVREQFEKKKLNLINELNATWQTSDLYASQVREYQTCRQACMQNCTQNWMHSHSSNTAIIDTDLARLEQLHVIRRNEWMQSQWNIKYLPTLQNLIIEQKQEAQIREQLEHDLRNWQKNARLNLNQIIGK